MATSTIGAAFDALDLTTITYTLLGKSVTPTVKNLSELPNTVNAGDLPMRLLIAVDGLAEGEPQQFLTLGAGASGGSFQMPWRVTDLCLMIPAAQGQGIKAVGVAMVSYMGKYADMVRNNRNIVAGISMKLVGISAGTYSYPGENGTLYFGVQSVLELLEIVS